MDKKKVLEFSDGPTWLIFEPLEKEGSVSVTSVVSSYRAVQDPDERLSIDKTVAVPKDAWITELIRTTEEYTNKIVELDPSLAESSDIKRLRKTVNDVKARFSEYVDE